MNDLIQMIKDLDLHQLILTGVAFYVIVRPWRKEVQAEIKSIHEEIQSVRQEVQEQGKRTDRLYEMFTNMQRDTSDRFYTLLKEMKEERK